MDYKAEITDPNDMASQFARKIALESHNNCPAITVRPHDARNWRGGTGVLWAKHVLEAMLQSHNSIGRSVMLEEMEKSGMISAMSGSGQREILVPARAE